MAWLDAITNFFGFAVCHQLPARSLELGGRYLPMCARCTGIYGGVALTYVYLIARRGFKVNALPPLPVAIGLSLLLLPMALDGATSYLGWRQTTNAVRLFTGLASGAILPVYAFPLLSADLVTAETATRRPVRPFGPWYDYALWAGIVSAGGVVFFYAPTWLYYPISVFTAVGVAAIFYNLAVVVWEMLLEKSRWGRRPRALLLAALTTAAVLGGLNLFHYFSFKAMLAATGGVLPQ